MKIIITSIDHIIFGSAISNNKFHRKRNENKLLPRGFYGLSNQQPPMSILYTLIEDFVHKFLNAYKIVIGIKDIMVSLQLVILNSKIAQNFI